GDDFWFTRYSSGQPMQLIQWGAPQDILTPADFDGDGKVDVAIWRPLDEFSGQGAFWILNSSTGTLRYLPFGNSLDDPSVTADYAGDHIADPAVFRCPPPATPGPCHYFYIGSQNNPGGSVTDVQWGNGDFKSVFAITGDFDGDGKADFCEYVRHPTADIPDQA